MDEKRFTSDYEEATYNSLKVLKKNGIRIICNDKDITEDIGDLE